MLEVGALKQVILVILILSFTKVHSVLALDAQALLDSNANEDEAGRPKVLEGAMEGVKAGWFTHCYS